MLEVIGEESKGSDVRGTCTTAQVFPSISRSMFLHLNNKEALQSGEECALLHVLILLCVDGALGNFGVHPSSSKTADASWSLRDAAN